LAVAAAAAALVAGVHAQPTFRSAVDLVTIPVTVAAKDGRVGELGVRDFRVYEDGVLQDLAVISHEPRPLSLCILLDSSPSMAPRQTLATRAIDTLLVELSPDDEVSLLMFASKVKVAVPWTRASAMRSFSWYTWRLSLGTALIDAMKEALAMMERATNTKPVILIVSDGADNTSGTPLSKLVATRRQSETLVYGVHTSGRPSRTVTPLNRAFAVDFLPDLVGDSGGTVYRVADGEGAEGAARAFLEELRSQYTLGYEPKKPYDGKYRHLKIDAVNPGLTVRHREGYLAQPR
jgi:VWFA-related protein